jgi:hypothetical protein
MATRYLQYKWTSYFLYQCVSIHQIVVILTKYKLNTNIVTIETEIGEIHFLNETVSV